MGVHFQESDEEEGDGSDEPAAGSGGEQESDEEMSGEEEEISVPDTDTVSTRLFHCALLSSTKAVF